METALITTENSVGFGEEPLTKLCSVRQVGFLPQPVHSSWANVQLGPVVMFADVSAGNLVPQTSGWDGRA